MTTTLPRRWATDTNYASGADVATPTRTDPGTGISAQGFLPFEGVPAQHLNALLGGIIDHQHSQIYDSDLFAHIRDDFMPGAYDATAELLHTDLTWRVTENSAATQGPVTNFADNPGVHFAQIPATESYEIHLGEEIIAGIVPWGQLESATIVFGLFSSNFTGAEAFVGLMNTVSDSGPGSNAVGLWFDHGTHATHWLIRNKHGGVADASDSTVPLVSGEFVVMKMKRVSTSLVEITLNGAGPFTLTDGTTGPTDGTHLNVGLYANAGASAALTVRWDLVDVVWSTPSRAT